MTATRSPARASAPARITFARPAHARKRTRTAPQIVTTTPRPLQRTKPAVDSPRMTAETRVEPKDTLPLAADTPARVGPGGVMIPRAGASFVLTPAVQAITDRALTYIECGYAVHLAGPAGTGKTTLAFHIAAQLGRPVTLLHGNDEFGTSDLVGKDAGYRKSTLVDNYIRSVLKTEERMDVHWTDNRLTTACEHGHTLIYDEFNRSRPEANNTLLSILEEGILDLPRSGGDGYMKVHPQFRAIFTSNPEEYAGTHKTQDALLDRLVTIKVDHYDAQTEQDVTCAKSGVDTHSARFIVELARAVRELTGDSNRPTIRACIALGRALQRRSATANPGDPFFLDAAWDLLGVGAEIGPDKRPFTRPIMDQLASEVFSALGGESQPARKRKSA